MNILSLVESQKEKNIDLLINKSMPQYKLWARMHLELHIKLGSLAEQTNCYNYSPFNQLDLDKDTIFLKYVDFLAHTINLGLIKNYIDSFNISLRPNDYCLSDQFLNLYIDINDLIISPSADHFHTLLEDTLSLGVTLGYCEDSIKNAFIFS